MIFLAKHNPGSDWSHITFAEKVGNHQFNRIALYCKYLFRLLLMLKRKLKILNWTTKLILVQA